jgi:hypothetical protein
LTDGPFAETKELIAGYWLIQVKSKEEAIERAKRCPFNCIPQTDGTGQIELRPLYEMALRRPRAPARSARWPPIRADTLHPYVGQDLVLIGILLMFAERVDEAQQPLREGTAILREALSPTTAQTRWAGTPGGITWQRPGAGRRPRRRRARRSGSAGWRCPRATGRSP